MRKIRGFSLIELMIVIVVVAILAAIAIPSYQDYIRKSRRADAKDAVTRIAAAQEKYFFTHNSYTVDLADLGYGSGTVESSEGWYRLSFNADAAADSADGTCGTDPNEYPCFTITATAINAQASDTKCASFSITQSGKKTAKNSGGTDNTDLCW